MSLATSRLSIITTVWWYNILYQTGDFCYLQRKTYIMLDNIVYWYSDNIVPCYSDDIMYWWFGLVWFMSFNATFNVISRRIVHWCSDNIVPCYSDEIVQLFWRYCSLLFWRYSGFLFRRYCGWMFCWDFALLFWRYCAWMLWLFNMALWSFDNIVYYYTTSDNVFSD